MQGLFKRNFHVEIIILYAAPGLSLRDKLIAFDDSRPWRGVAAAEQRAVALLPKGSNCPSKRGASRVLLHGGTLFEIRIPRPLAQIGER